MKNAGSDTATVHVSPWKRRLTLLDPMETPPPPKKNKKKTNKQMKGSGPGEWSDIAKIGQSTKDLRGISQPCRGDGGPDSAAQGETHSPAFLFHFFSAQLLAPFAVSFSCVCVCVSARSDTEGEAHSKKRWSECHRKWLRQLSPTGNATRRSSISCSAVIPFPATSLNEWPSLVFRPPPRPFPSPLRGS